MTLVTAEIGVNWNGDFQIAKEMMSRSKKAGCNSVKFQSFTYDMIKTHPQCDLIIKSSISKKNIDEINNIAKEVGIEWFCTPMFSEAIDFLEPYVQRFKIRELDSRILLENKTSEMIDKIFKTKKEIIASSQSNPKNSKYYDKIKWLYVVPKYPCELTDLNFKDINDFYGYSNHCSDIIAPLSASILGSKIIEVHVTLDKSKEFFDNNVSFSFEELTELIRYIKLAEKIKK